MNNDNYELALMWTYIWNYIEGENGAQSPQYAQYNKNIIELCLKYLGWNGAIESFLISWNYHSLLRQVKAVQEAA